jgi:hypothetical protein
MELGAIIGLTIMIALSSESFLTIELTVEYSMGLAHPETPNKYQAKNLAIFQSQPHEQYMETRDNLL